MFNHEWYQILNKPPLTPPAGIFSPVWVFLYITMFISLIIYITTPVSLNKIKGYILFILQISLNIIWTPIFFMYKNIALALIIIILLDIAVIFNIREFGKVSKLSAGILIPYLVWILFATYLNAGLLILNTP